MITYHEFMFPIDPKHLSCLRVIRQPCARVIYRAVDENETEITEISLHPIVLIHLSRHSDFFEELEHAAKEHYKDEYEKPEPEYNDLERQENNFL